MATPSTALAVVESGAPTLTLTGRIWRGVRSFFAGQSPQVALAADPSKNDPAPVRAGPPDRREHREIPLPFTVEWDRLPEIRAILRELEQGLFNRASLLSIFQERDDRLAGCWAIRVNTLLGTPLEFEPALIDGAVTEESAAVADAAGVDWPNMFPEGSLDCLFKQGLDLGLAVGELVVAEDEATGRWVPRLKSWHTQWVWWNWGTESYWISTSGAYGPDGQPVMDGAGVLELPRVDRDVYSDGHWVVYAPGGYRYAFQRGLIRSTAQLTLYRGWDRRDNARWNELYGLGIREAKMPAGASEPDKTRFANSVRNLGNESTVECPVDENGNGFGVEIKTAGSGTGWQTFGESLHYDDECIGNIILGQQASGEKKASLGNGDSDQNEKVRQDILEKDARLYEILQQQVLHHWTVWNFGNAALTPTVTALTDPPESTTHKAEKMKAAGEAAQAIRAAFPNADMDAIAAEMGVPLLAPGETPAPVTEDEQGTDPPVGKLAVRALKAGSRRPLFADRVAAAATAHAAAVMRPDIADIKRIVRESKSPDELRAALTEKYRAMRPEKLADVIEKAAIVAELEGRLDVLDSSDSPVARYDATRALKGANFDEAKHPRADDGKFGSGGGSHSSDSDDESVAERHRANYKPAQTAPVARKTIKGDDGKEKSVGGASPGAQLPPAVLDRLKKLGVTKLPPAHIHEVHVSDDLHGADDIVHGHALVIWKDDKGRRQSAYTPEFDRRNAEEKFRRVLENRPKLEKAIPELREKAASSPSHAAALLIAQTGLRPGSNESVKHEGHYGATTMEARHLHFAADGAHIEYVGKEGVVNRAHVTDPALVAALKKNVEGKAPTDRVFSGVDGTKVSDVLPEGVKVKDLRTTIATATAEKLLGGIDPGLTGDEKKDLKAVVGAIKEVSERVSSVLNNTPAMARKSYIAPQVIRAWGEKHGVPKEWLE